MTGLKAERLKNERKAVGLFHAESQSSQRTGWSRSSATASLTQLNTPDLPTSRQEVYQNRRIGFDFVLNNAIHALRRWYGSFTHRRRQEMDG